MKALTKSLAVVGLSFGLIGMANASSELIAADDTVSTKLCMTAATGSRLQVHNAMKDAGVSRQFVETKVFCNGLPIVEFVAQHSSKADSVNNYITGGKYQGENYIANVNNHKQ